MNVVSRSDWGARPPLSPFYLPPPGAFVNGMFGHHSVTSTGPDEAAIVRGIQAYHQDHHGWKDIAYSWLVGQSGTIFEGRGWGVAGGHTKGYNATSHAVCFIGNSDTDTPTVEALRAMDQVIEEGLRLYGGPVRPHHAVSQTACPGSFLTTWIAEGRPVTPPHTPDPEDEMSQEQYDALMAKLDRLGSKVAHIEQQQDEINNSLLGQGEDIKIIRDDLRKLKR